MTAVMIANITPINTLIEHTPNMLQYQTTKGVGVLMLVIIIIPYTNTPTHAQFYPYIQPHAFLPHNNSRLYKYIRMYTYIVIFTNDHHMHSCTYNVYIQVTNRIATCVA